MSRQFLFLSFVNHLQSCPSQQHQNDALGTGIRNLGLNPCAVCTYSMSHCLGSCQCVLHNDADDNIPCQHYRDCLLTTTQIQACQAVFQGRHIKPKDVSSMKQMKKTFGSTAQQECITVVHKRQFPVISITTHLLLERFGLCRLARLACRKSVLAASKQTRRHFVQPIDAHDRLSIHDMTYYVVTPAVQGQHLARSN